MVNYNSFVFVFIGMYLMVIDSRFNILHFVNNYESFNESNRLVIWSNLNELIRNNWLFGVGLGDAKIEIIDTYIKNGFEKALLKNTTLITNLYS